MSDDEAFALLIFKHVIHSVLVLIYLIQVVSKESGEFQRVVASSIVRIHRIDNTVLPEYLITYNNKCLSTNVPISIII
ncbi:hypothetical protein I4U23_012380 [Adineta vaga]|nr:hypothetical protein I4U23_012380 [Adineta vaga]